MNCLTKEEQGRFLINILSLNRLLDDLVSGQEFYPTPLTTSFCFLIKAYKSWQFDTNQ